MQVDELEALALFEGQGVQVLLAVPLLYEPAKHTERSKNAPHGYLAIGKDEVIGTRGRHHRRATTCADHVPAHDAPDWL